MSTNDALGSVPVASGDGVDQVAVSGQVTMPDLPAIPQHDRYRLQAASPAHDLDAAGESRHDRVAGDLFDQIVETICRRQDILGYAPPGRLLYLSHPLAQLGDL